MRRISWIGLAGAIVFLIGYFLLSAVPGGGEVQPADFEEFYVTDDRTGTAILAMFLVTLGALGLLWLLWELRTGMGSALSGLAFVSGALGLALVTGGAALLEAPSGVQAFSDGEFVGVPVAHALAQAGWAAILVGGALFLGLAIAVFSAEGRRTGTLAGWVAIAGFVAALLQLGAFIWVPSLAIPLWFILVAVTGIRARTAGSDVGPAT
jgi:hypothetical protein